MRRPRLHSLATLVAGALALLATGCGGGGESNGGGGNPAPPTVCKQVTAPPAERRTGERPTAPLPAGSRPTLTFATNCGTFVVTLHPESSPHATASLVALARAGFYDATIVHRIVPDFVIQGGDPGQDGGGGPGYSTVDPPRSDTAYTKGVVAMAKTELEPAGTAGSQWFIVTGADVGLPPDYAVVGTVTDGLDVVDAIGRLGDETQRPTETVVVSSVTVGGT